MATFTVATSMNTGRTRDWTNPASGETITFNMWSVTFSEMPGMNWELSRTARATPPVVGMKLDGEIQVARNGQQYFKEAKKAANNNGGFQRNGQQNGQQYSAPANNGRRYGGSTDQAIMAQVALKEAVQTGIAAQKFDPAYADTVATAYMETMLKLSSLKVDAAPADAPQAPPAPAPSPHNDEEVPF